MVCLLPVYWPVDTPKPTSTPKTDNQRAPGSKNQLPTAPPSTNTATSDAAAPSSQTAANVDQPIPSLTAWTMPPGERAALVSALWLSAVLFTCGFTIADPDLWGHTLYGMRAAEQGLLVEKTDPFSYTAPNAPWINHEWLTEYQFGWLWKQLGATGLWMWRNLLVITVFVVAALAFRQARASVAAVAALLVFNAECLSGFVIFVRPQLATFALFAVTLYILRRWWDAPHNKMIWVLPLLMGFWVNLHGGFLAGLGLQAVFVLGAGTRWFRNSEERRAALSIAAVFTLSLLATLVNPNGLALHTMLYRHLAFEQFVREWQPLWIARQSLIYYAPFLLIGLSLVSSRRLQMIDLFVLAVVGFQAVSHIRHVALLGIATLVLLPGPLTDSLERLFRRIASQWSGAGSRRIRIAAVASVVALLASIQIHSSWELCRYGIRPWEIAVETQRDVPGVPLRAIGLMKREGLTGNLVTDYGWAQYVLWHMYPDVRVAFDGRYRTVYSRKLESEFLDFQRAATQRPERTAILDNYATEMALLPIERGPGAYLDSRSDWVRVFADQQAALYVKDIPKFQRLIARSRSHKLIVPEVPAWQKFPGNVFTDGNRLRLVASRPRNSGEIPERSIASQ